MDNKNGIIVLTTMAGIGNINEENTEPYTRGNSGEDGAQTTECQSLVVGSEKSKSTKSPQTFSGIGIDAGPNLQTFGPER